METVNLAPAKTTASGGGTPGDSGAPAGAPGAGREAVRSDVRASGLLRHWAMLAVLAAYGLSALVVPTMANVAISDDWTYTRSVEILLEQRRLVILDIAGANALFQILWGAPFARVFGVFGGLRVATVVFVAVSAVALYLLCRELRLSRSTSALGAAMYLFNPLVYVLSFTFMSDPYFTGLLVIAMAGFARGLRGDRWSGWWTVAASAVTAVSLAQRTHGVFIPAAMITYLAVSRRLRADKESALAVARVVVLPVAAYLALVAWNPNAGGTSAQSDFVSEVTDAGWDETWLLIRRLSFIEIMYLGLFGFPIAVAALATVKRAKESLRRPGLVTLAAIALILNTGLWFFSTDGRRMPYIPHFLVASGLGPADLAIPRGALVSPRVLSWITAICAVSALVLVTTILARFTNRSSTGRDVAGLVFAVGAWQMAAAIFPSFAFRNWQVAGVSAPSLDRYLLPLIPCVVVIGLWALHRSRGALIAAWVATALLGAFAVTGTRDSIAYQQATWDMARHAHELGVATIRLDAGYAWDAYHLWEASDDQRIKKPRTVNPPWWIIGFAPIIDNHYVVATGRLPGWRVVAEEPYDLWLEDDGTVMYLLRRPDVPPLPTERSPLLRGGAT